MVGAGGGYAVPPMQTDWARQDLLSHPPPLGAVAGEAMNDLLWQLPVLGLAFVASSIALYWWLGVISRMGGG